MKFALALAVLLGCVACSTPESGMSISESQTSAARAAAQTIDLAVVETEDGTLPPGWTALVGDDERARYYSRDGAIYFEFFGGAKTLSYALPSEASGPTALSFDWAIDGNAPACRASISQGENEATITPNAGLNRVQLRVQPGLPARVRFVCTSDGKIWGWIREPRLTIGAP